MKNLIEQLQLLDIPKRESEVYVALLQKKEFTASEIAKITSVNRTKSYEVLQNLVKKGLCSENFRNGIKVFSAVNPQVVLESFRNDFEKKKLIIDQLNVTLSQLYKEKENDLFPVDYIEVLTDIGQIKEKFSVIQKNTKKEILVFTKPPYIKKLEDNITDASTKLAPNTLIKSIYEYKGLTNEEIYDLIKVIEEFQLIGEEAKLIEELPMKLVVSDEAVTMFVLEDRVSLNNGITTMVVDHPSFAKALKNVFESYWVNGMTIEEFKERKLMNTYTE